MGRSLKTELPTAIRINVHTGIAKYLRFLLDINPQKTLTAIISEILLREMNNDPNYNGELNICQSHDEQALSGEPPQTT